MNDRGSRLPVLLALFVLICGCAVDRTAGERPPAEGDSAHAALLQDIRGQMVTIPAGTFTMGGESGVGEDEHPQHEVTLPAFRLARFEVTAAQFSEFGVATGRRTAQGDRNSESRPAVNVSWDDAQAFIDWLNALGGGRYRLPTEAEWEYAARAGSTTAYWWGDTFDGGHLNGTGIAGKDRWLETAPVGQFVPNAFGLYDMLGNVWEWTQDCYRPSYQGAARNGSAPREENGCGRVLRGGSWSDRPEWLRSATRNWFDRTDRFDYVGFRLAHD